jgi:hypothetical protein
LNALSADSSNGFSPEYGRESKPKTFHLCPPEQRLLSPPSPLDWLPEPQLLFLLLVVAAELDRFTPCRPSSRDELLDDLASEQRPADDGAAIDHKRLGWQELEPLLRSPTSIRPSSCQSMA